MREAALEINLGLLAICCGSYRRGKATCGDVDVLITHPDGKSHRGVFSRIINSLKERGECSASVVVNTKSPFTPREGVKAESLSAFYAVAKQKIHCDSFSRQV